MSTRGVKKYATNGEYLSLPWNGLPTPPNAIADTKVSQLHTLLHKAEHQ